MWTRSVIILLVVLATPSAQAANVYLRQGASGANNGADWTNAYTSIVAAENALSRGDTLYVADGTYTITAVLEFNALENGTSVITIKKATVADHGTSAGWDDTYGDGQAAIVGDLVTCSRDYYVFDGQTRNASNWRDEVAYGLWLENGLYLQDNNFPPGGDHITLRYCNLGPAYNEDDVSLGAAVYILGLDHTYVDITVSRCFLHNSSFIQAANVDGIVIEYNAFAAGWAKEAIRGQGRAKNGIIRFNVFSNASQKDPEDPTSGTTAEIGIWDGSANDFDNWEIYGNIFVNTKSIEHSGGVIVVGGDGVGFVGSPTNNTVVYNNTIWNITGGFTPPHIIVNGGSGNVVRNNLWYACEGSPTATANTTSNNIEVGADPFVNTAASNFHLAGATSAGFSLSSPYNVDFDGEIRGADSNWDLGAYEFDAGGPPGPTITTGSLTIGAVLP